MRKAVVAITLAGIAGSLVLSVPSAASAQSRGNAMSPTGKGIVGCALLGAETVALIEAAAGARPRWAYIVFPLLGAGAGAAAGYFLENAASTSSSSTLTGVSVGTLVLGLGLVVPTVIAYVNATSYHPENDQANEDNAPANSPIDEATTPAAPPAGGGAAPATAPSSTPAPQSTGGTASVHPGGSGRRMAAASTFRPTGLLDVTGQGLSLAVPAISVENSVSLQDMRQYGLSAQNELRVPLLSGSF